MSGHHPHDPLRLLFAGYYGFNNAGDELILKTLLGELKSLSTPVEVRVLSANPEETQSLHSVAAANRWSAAQCLRSLWASNVLVFGGGGLLQDKTGLGSLWYYLSILWAALLMRKKIWVLCAGVGPVRSPVNRWLVKLTLGFCDFVSVRDEGSKKELERYGLRKSVSVLKDPVFDLNVHPRSNHKNGLPNFAFVVRSAGDKKERKDLIDSLSHSAAYFIKIFNADLHLATFQPGRDEEFLNDLHSRVREEIPLDSVQKIHIHPYKSLDEVLSLMRRQDLVVTMRYHGAVLSVLNRTPVLGISVDPKLPALLSEIFPSDPPSKNLLELNQLSSESVISSVENLWTGREEVQKDIEESLKHFKNRKTGLSKLISQETSGALHPAHRKREDRSDLPHGSSLEHTRRFVFFHPLLFGLSILLPFLFTVLFSISKDAENTFLTQRGALVLEVFAKTDLNPENYPLIEEALRAVPGVKEVVATSPEEGLSKLALDPNFNVDPNWLKDKTAALKNKNTILPWSYDVHLERWDEPSLREVLVQLQNVQVGIPKTPAINEVHYDSERWSLVFALYNYLKWIRAVLMAGAAVFVLFAALAAVKTIHSRALRSFFKERLGAAIVLSFLAGAASHFLYLGILSATFFSGSPLWQSKFGEYFLLQLGIAFILIGASLAAVQERHRP